MPIFQYKSIFFEPSSSFSFLQLIFEEEWFFFINQSVFLSPSSYCDPRIFFVMEVFNTFSSFAWAASNNRSLRSASAWWSGFGRNTVDPRGTLIVFVLLVPHVTNQHCLSSKGDQKHMLLSKSLSLDLQVHYYSLYDGRAWFSFKSFGFTWTQ